MRLSLPSRSPGCLCAIACAAIVTGCGHSQPTGHSSSAPAHPSAMTLTSTEFADGQPLPAEFTCDGAGRSPELQWSDPPAAAQSLALVVEDTDAPRGPFGHWGVYNIPTSARQLDAGAAETETSELKQTNNDFGGQGYGPPCPPRGDPPHHYHFRLLALDRPSLKRRPKDIRTLLGDVDHHILASAQIVALYARK
jgi:Raf kinase inhibitor-like YbhB/YbcL family protein